MQTTEDNEKQILSRGEGGWWGEHGSVRGGGTNEGKVEKGLEGVGEGGSEWMTEE